MRGASVGDRPQGGGRSLRKLASLWPGPGLAPRPLRWRRRPRGPQGGGRSSLVPPGEALWALSSSQSGRSRTGHLAARVPTSW
eukprot:12011697-Alexandrium_andersonii.AAC.1